jgi:hypothetical protein
MSKAFDNSIRNISNVFDEIQKTISVVGEKGFMKMLVDVREDSQLTYQNEIAKNIIQITAKEFDISVKEMLYGSLRANDKTHALGIITFILVTQHDFTLKNCSLVLNKNLTNLSRYKKNVERYDPNHPLDIERIEKLNSIKHKLKLLQDHE